MTPMQHAIGYAKEHGFHYDIVEHWNPYSRKRHDLFGFADLVLVRVSERRGTASSPSIWFVQVTSAANHAAREAKVRGNEVARVIAEIPSARVEVWSFPLRLTGERRKDGKLSKRKTRQLRRTSPLG